MVFCPYFSSNSLSKQQLAFRFQGLANFIYVNEYSRNSINRTNCSIITIRIFGLELPGYVGIRIIKNPDNRMYERMNEMFLSFISVAYTLNRLALLAGLTACLWNISLKNYNFVKVSYANKLHQ